mmetsp:Transcript_70155/g.126448  ORF Transcript_70155/g.126448 Transcript_70155/m.126448 type:complete len:207 (+) Transcript_70155:151-771(+)
MASSPRQVPCSSLNSLCFDCCSELKVAFTLRRAVSKSCVPISRGTIVPAAAPSAPARLRVIAALASRTGPMAASRRSCWRSEPEKPEVRSAIPSMSVALSAPFKPSPALCFASCRRRSARRATPPGNGTYRRLGSRRSAAKSSSQGMLVAPTSSTLSSAAVSAPSRLVKNSFLTRRDDSLSALWRWLSRESISSMNITDGCLSVAS